MKFDELDEFLTNFWRTWRISDEFETYLPCLYSSSNSVYSVVRNMSTQCATCTFESVLCWGAFDSRKSFRIWRTSDDVWRISDEIDELLTNIWRASGEHDEPQTNLTNFWLVKKTCFLWVVVKSQPLAQVFCLFCSRPLWKRHWDLTTRTCIAGVIGLWADFVFK